MACRCCTSIEIIDRCSGASGSGLGACPCRRLHLLDPPQFTRRQALPLAMLSPKMWRHGVDRFLTASQRLPSLFQALNCDQRFALAVKSRRIVWPAAHILFQRLVCFGKLARRQISHAQFAPNFMRTAFVIERCSFAQPRDGFRGLTFFDCNPAELERWIRFRRVDLDSPRESRFRFVELTPLLIDET